MSVESHTRGERVCVLSRPGSGPTRIMVTTLCNIRSSTYQFSHSVRTSPARHTIVAPMHRVPKRLATISHVVISETLVLKRFAVEHLSELGGFEAIGYLRAVTRERKRVEDGRRLEKVGEGEIA